MTAAATSPAAPAAAWSRTPARQVKDLSGEGIRALFYLWQQDGDRRAREQLCERFLPLARSLARRYANSHESIDDLIGVAYLGLVKAIDRFDATRDVAFSSYAVPTILGELRRHFRDRGWGVHVPRGTQEAALKVEKAAKDLSGRTGRDPGPQLIAEHLEWPLETVLDAIEANAGHFSASLDAPIREDDGDAGTVLSTFGAEDPEYAMVDARLTLAQAIGTLPSHLRQVVVMRFDAELTQKQIGDRLGISQMQVSRLLRQALDEIRAQTDHSTRHG